MTDDIVTRLRDYLAIVDHAFVWNELSDAADEIERLRALVKELLPFMLEDVIQGVMLGEPPFDPNHCDDASDKCPDCVWFIGSTKWKARIDSGEFSQYD